MLTKHPPISREQLVAVLEYEPSSGIFRWRESRRYGIHAGSIAGSLSSFGYWRITIARRNMLAHRLAWLYMHEEWPQDEIDHIDGDRLNNRIANLRLADRALNTQNIGAARRGSVVPLLGVSMFKGKFKAQIRANKKHYHLGYFDTAEEAHAAYVRAKKELHVWDRAC